mmetsp:Transcript_12710/g.15478  ORF Transcript_12710/g.15478 Transcript_12710/m.15478 type:complete len:114 (+) Transcript_12710:146-487(+)
MRAEKITLVYSENVNKTKHLNPKIDKTYNSGVEGTRHDTVCEETSNRVFVGQGKTRVFRTEGSHTPKQTNETTLEIQATKRRSPTKPSSIRNLRKNHPQKRARATGLFKKCGP